MHDHAAGNIWTAGLIAGICDVSLGLRVGVVFIVVGWEEAGTAESDSGATTEGEAIRTEVLYFDTVEIRGGTEAIEPGLRFREPE